MFFLYLRHQAVRIVNIKWEMSDLNKWDVTLSQSKADYSFQGIVN